LTLSAAILSLLLALPVHKSDRQEPVLDRQARLAGVAEAISAAVDRATCHGQPDGCKAIFRDRLLLAGVVFEVARGESAFSGRVQSCQCERYECDPHKRKGGEVVHLARGLWQAHQFGLAAAHWEELCVDVNVAAWVATRQLAGAINACGSVAGGLTRYGWGSTCLRVLSSERDKRVQMWAAKLRGMVTE
jgi:hypothetical protein